MDRTGVYKSESAALGIAHLVDSSRVHELRPPLLVALRELRKLRLHLAAESSPYSRRACWCQIIAVMKSARQKKNGSGSKRACEGCSGCAKSHLRTVLLGVVELRENLLLRILRRLQLQLQLLRRARRPTS